MGRRLATIGVAALLIYGAYRYFTSTPGVPVDVDVAEVGVIRTYVEEEATTELPLVHLVTMPLAGRIQPITLEAGDRVEEGQQVATMDVSDLETDLAVAKAKVEHYSKLIEATTRTIASAEEQIVATRAKVEHADAEYKRAMTLAERNALSESLRKQAELAQIESRVALKKDELMLSMHQAQLAATEMEQQDAQETLAKRQRDLERAKITSPVSGVVLSRQEASERVLAAGEVLLEVGNLELLRVESEVLTQDAAQVEVQDSVEIAGEAIGPEPIMGVVTRIDPQGFKKISSLGVEQQRVRIIVDFVPGALQKLKANGRQLGVDYRVYVRIFTQEKSNVVRVARPAIFRGPDDSWQAFVVRDGHARLVNVKVGLMNDLEAEIVEGISEGDRVILAPESNLEDNQRVDVIG